MCGKNRFRNLALLSAGTLAGTLAGTEAASAEGRNGSEAPKKPNILFLVLRNFSKYIYKFAWLK